MKRKILSWLIDVLRESLNKCEKKMTDNNKRNEILDQWTKQWSSLKYDAFFKDLFTEVYEDVKWKERSNDQGNREYKNRFLNIHKRIFFLLLLLLLAGTILNFLNNYYEWFPWFHPGWADVAGVGAVCLMLAVWKSAVTSKWIDIKKYQETWARHSLHRQQMENEMLLFCYSLPPYDDPDREKIFMKHIFAMWTANHIKFINNIETKEKGLMDMVDRIIPPKAG